MNKRLWGISVAISDILPDSYPSLLRGDFIQSIKIAKQIGFDAVELHIANPVSLSWTAVGETCKAHEISVSGISTGLSFTEEKLSVLSDDDIIRDCAKKRMIDYVELASKLHCAVIIGLMRGWMPANVDKKEYQARFKEYIASLLEYAQKRDVILVIEAINRFENNMFQSSHETTDFVRMFSSPYLKVHLDTYHMNIEESDLVDAIYYAGKDLGYIHFSDSNRKIPGLGHINFYSIGRTLRNIGFKGFLTVEALPIPDPINAARFCYSFLDNLINLIGLDVEN